MIRPGDVFERADVEAIVDGECRAGPVYAFETEKAFADGVAFLLADAPEDGARLIELAAAEAALGRGEELPPEEAALLAGAREALTEHWPPYRTLISREARRRQYFPAIAFRRFCVGWEGEDLPEFRLGADGEVPVALLGEIPPLEMKAAGAFAVSLLYASGREKEGNSERLSSSAESRKTSSSRTPRRGGKSQGSASSRRTPSSRSRPGPSPS